MTSPRTTRMIVLFAALGLGAVVGVNVQAPIGEPAAAVPWIGFEDLNSTLPATTAEQTFDLAALISWRG